MLNCSTATSNEEKCQIVRPSTDLEMGVTHLRTKRFGKALFSLGKESGRIRGYSIIRFFEPVDVSVPRNANRFKNVKLSHSDSISMLSRI